MATFITLVLKIDMTAIFNHHLNAHINIISNNFVGQIKWAYWGKL